MAIKIVALMQECFSYTYLGNSKNESRISNRRKRQNERVNGSGSKWQQKLYSMITTVNDVKQPNLPLIYSNHQYLQLVLYALAQCKMRQQRSQPIQFLFHSAVLAGQFSNFKYKYKNKLKDSVASKEEKTRMKT